MKNARPSPSRITIGLTCFNAEQTIGRAIHSAQAQDWPNLEIIVADDASTDTSWTILEAIALQDQRIKIIRHPLNGGPAAARNTILNAATGDFVAFFDDDDESFPERIRTQHEKLLQYEAACSTTLIACYASGVRYYPNGYKLDMPAIGSQPLVPFGEAVADYLLFNNREKDVFFGSGTPTCSLMARLSTFRAIGGFDENLRRVEDIDFAVRLAKQGGHFIGCHQPLFLQHATTAADKTPEKNLEAELRLLNKHAPYLRKKNRLDYAQHWFRIRYYHFSGQHFRFGAALFLFLLKYPVAGICHLLRSAPQRWLHERKMKAQHHN